MQSRKKKVIRALKKNEMKNNGNEIQSDLYFTK